MGKADFQECVRYDELEMLLVNFGVKKAVS